MNATPSHQVARKLELCTSMLESLDLLQPGRTSRRAMVTSQLLLLGLHLLLGAVRAARGSSNNRPGQSGHQGRSAGAGEERGLSEGGPGPAAVRPQGQLWRPAVRGGQCYAASSGGVC